MSYIEEEIETPKGIVRVFCSEDVAASGRLMIHESGEAFASESPSLNLSSITKAARDKDLLTALKGGELRGFISAIYISYLRRMLSWESDSEMRERWDYEIKRQVYGSRHDVTMDEVEEGFFERRVEENLAYAFNQTGHAGVYAIGKLIEVVEMKSRFATEEERFFLKCVKDATEEVGGVPTQKTVFNRWYDPSLRTSHDTFRGIRDRLGFSWLPQGKRGKTGARDEELGRDSQRWCEGEPT